MICEEFNDFTIEFDLRIEEVLYCGLILRNKIDDCDVMICDVIYVCVFGRDGNENEDGDGSRPGGLESGDADFTIY